VEIKSTEVARISHALEFSSPDGEVAMQGWHGPGYKFDRVIRPRDTRVGAKTYYSYSMIKTHPSLQGKNNTAGS